MSTAMTTPPQSSDLVLYRREGPIVQLTLNRPDKLNAFSDELVVALIAALRRFDSDEDALVAVLSGAGRAFSSGAD
ncbi:MAG: enoyl-CoA hydratase/isomerase family protein, partial [Burkholderiales bacterium]